MPYLYLSRVCGLEKTHKDLRDDVTATLEKLQVLRAMLRHLQVDLRNGEQTDEAWLHDEFAPTADRAWEACRKLKERVDTESIDDTLTSRLVTLVAAAREAVQADNACNLGRAGCEQRWDKAMEVLKSEVARVKD